VDCAGLKAEAVCKLVTYRGGAEPVPGARFCQEEDLRLECFVQVLAGDTETYPVLPLIGLSVIPAEHVSRLLIVGIGVVRRGLIVQHISGRPGKGKGCGSIDERTGSLEHSLEVGVFPIFNMGFFVMLILRMLYNKTNDV